MAVTLTITGGTMKVEGVYANPVFISASNSIFKKDANLEYYIYAGILRQEYAIGNAANVNGGITDAALEALLSGFFSNAADGGSVSDCCLEKYTGEVWYVDGIGGLDANSGKYPELAFQTIGKAIATCASGDLIKIKGATYTEVGLDLNKNNVQIECSSGTIIAPATGTGLIISGDYCKIRSGGIIQHAADTIGLLISGNGFTAYNLLTVGSLAVVGVQITGSLCEISNVKVSGIKSTGKCFDIQGNIVSLKECKAIGGTTSYGFYVSGTTGILTDCSSTNNQESGFYFDSGVTDWTIKECTSGAGDGKWLDIDNVQMWNGFTFDNEKYNRTDFSVVGGSAGSQNLFKVTGAVEIYGLRANVESDLHADINNVKYESFDGAASNITNNVDSAAAPVGSLFAKEGKSGDALVLYNSAAASLIEEVDLKKAVFGINSNATSDTYIRFTWSGTGNSGILHHHIIWEPLTEDGFITSL